VASINKLSTEFSVVVSGSGTINKAYLYTPTHSRFQTTATIYPETKYVNDSVKLNIEKISKVVISKQDATTGEELSGAKLTVKDENGNVVDSWTSTEESHIIEGLKPGKYTLTEEMAPEGYKLSTETVTFVVKEDGTVDGKVVMYNSPKKSVLISKKDFTTGEELPGAKLELRNEKGELIEAWVSTNEPHVIEGLEPGKYTLTEVLAPEGYELSKETITFTVNEDGTVDGDVIMYNKPETVEVPSTGTFKTITTSLIGLLIIGLGSALIYRNYKKNNGEI
jgi:LPXTG-motif cell wall-anchored protein